MNEQGGDFLISEVACGEDASRIVSAAVWQDLGDMFAGRQTMSRELILAHLAAGRVFRTLVRDGKGDWKKGRTIDVQMVGRVGFLKVDPDGRPADTLVGVPRVAERRRRVATGSFAG